MEKLNLNYKEIDGIFYPQIKLKETKPLRKYGRLRRDYLKEHHSPIFNHLLLSDELFTHLNEVDDQAQALLDEMMPKYIEHFGITAELKRTNQMEWVRLMNMAHSICEEFIFDRIVYK